MVTEYDWLPGGFKPLPSSALIVKLYVPAALGVPLIVAVGAVPPENDRPGGRVPDELHEQQVGRRLSVLSV